MDHYLNPNDDYTLTSEELVVIIKHLKGKLDEANRENQRLLELVQRNNRGDKIEEISRDFYQDYNINNKG